MNDLSTSRPGPSGQCARRASEHKNQGDCVSYFATKGKNLGAVPPVAVAADATATHVKHPTKHQDAPTATTQTTERPHGKFKAKNQNAHGHGSKSHKSD